MLHKTRGIVISTINYNDKYILATIYTQKLGRATYMITKSNSKTAKVRRSLFSPMFILDLEVDHKPSRDIQRIKEAHNDYPLYSISTNFIKTSIIIFLSDFLNKILRDSDNAELIFRFLFNSILILESSTERSLANFHIVFMLKLSQFLGFYPNFENYNKGYIFDMLNGTFVKEQPLHKHFVNKGESEIIASFGRIRYENMHLFDFSRNDRLNIINRILEYYKIHLHEFSTLKSLDVLHELF